MNASDRRKQINRSNAAHASIRSKKSLDSVQLVSVESIPVGEFVRRAERCVCAAGCEECDGLGFTPMRKTFKRAKYDNSTKRFALEDCDDISREVFVKKGTKLFVGFTY